MNKCINIYIYKSLYISIYLSLYISLFIFLYIYLISLFLYNVDPQKWTNHQIPRQDLDQSNMPNNSLTSISNPTPTQPPRLELLEPENEQQQMLQDKMMMDPVISLILFNEYIPLRARVPSNKKHDSDISPSSSSSAICERIGGLFLGKVDDPPGKENSNLNGAGASASDKSIFIRSELPPPAEANKPTATGGIFIRSEDSSDPAVSDDWVIA